MNPIELRARREALGLAQDGLAAVLGVKQSTVSLWEGGKRGIPAGADAELARLEDRVLDMIDQMVELVEEAPEVSVLLVHTEQAGWDAAHPDGDGSPPVLQRIAAARALVELREAGRAVSIIDAAVS